MKHSYRNVLEDLSKLQEKETDRISENTKLTNLITSIVQNNTEYVDQKVDEAIKVLQAKIEEENVKQEAELQQTIKQIKEEMKGNIVLPEAKSEDEAN